MLKCSSLLIKSGVYYSIKACLSFNSPVCRLCIHIQISSVSFLRQWCLCFHIEITVKIWHSSDACILHFPGQINNGKDCSLFQACHFYCQTEFIYFLKKKNENIVFLEIRSNVGFTCITFLKVENKITNYEFYSCIKSFVALDGNFTTNKQTNNRI